MRKPSSNFTACVEKSVIWEKMKVETEVRGEDLERPSKECSGNSM
jgi:hypothetical protein